MTGINLLYLPPFSIVARFFLTAAFFGFLGTFLATYMILSDSFSLPAIVHTYTLGFMAMTMLGALFQMLPVVAGAVIEDPLPKATFTHVSFGLGAVLFVLGFLLYNHPVIYVGLLLISAALLFIVPLMLLKLFLLKSYTPTSRGMKFSLTFFLAAFFVGVLLLLTSGGFLPASYGYLLELHMALMLWGWVALLIASVAFQVIEMFFVTSPYPQTFSRNFPILYMAALLLNALLGFPWPAKVLISLLYLSFALLTIMRLRGRRRKVPDPLVSFWYAGMFFLMLSCILYPATGTDHRIFFLFLFAFGTFAQSVIFAMMYRIIPFLVWIHLSNRGIPDAPTMHEVIRPRRIWLNFYLHIFGITIFLPAFALNSKMLWLVTALVYSSSFALLLLNLSSGVLTYLRKASEPGASPQR